MLIVTTEPSYPSCALNRPQWLRSEVLLHGSAGGHLLFTVMQKGLVIMSLTYRLRQGTWLQHFLLRQSLLVAISVLFLSLVSPR